MDDITRGRSTVDQENLVPVHVVWELTLACDLKCQMCGSRAGTRRRDELTLEDCFRVIDRLKELGTREITIIGGEAYLKKGWLDIIRHITDSGMLCSMQSGGRNLDEIKLLSARQAGLKGIGISLDGTGATHDMLRGVSGSFDRAISALKTARSLGMRTTVNSQISKSTAREFPALMEALADVGVTHWQVQLSVAMGNAVDNSEELLDPFDLLDIMPMIASLYRQASKRGILITVGNNVGFFGPYEHFLRGFGDEEIHWGSCGAGTTAMGLEANGTIKGCPSLATNDFGDGNILTDDIREIWTHSPRIGFARKRKIDDLWGFCRHCYYADQCRAGCTWTSHSLTGKTGNNPYCHFRALTLDKAGLRERIVKISDAANTPFAIGNFRIALEENQDGTWTEIPEDEHDKRYQLTGVEPRHKTSAAPHIAEQMALCRHCSQYIWADEDICPHCDGDVAEGIDAYETRQQRIKHAMDVIDKALGSAGAASHDV